MLLMLLEQGARIVDSAQQMRGQAQAPESSGECQQRPAVAGVLLQLLLVDALGVVEAARLQVDGAEHLTDRDRPDLGL